MSAKVSFAVAALLGVSGAGISGVSRAQTAPQSDSNAGALETIVVTAQKREESLKDVPMSVTALGGEELEELQARDFADYAALVPGLSLASGQTGLGRIAESLAEPGIIKPEAQWRGGSRTLEWLI